MPLGERDELRREYDDSGRLISDDRVFETAGEPRIEHYLERKSSEASTYRERALDERTSLWPSVARAAEYSQRHFQRIVKALTGERTLKTYIRARRLVGFASTACSRDEARVLDSAISPRGCDLAGSFRWAFKEGVAMSRGVTGGIGARSGLSESGARLRITSVHINSGTCRHAEIVTQQARTMVGRADGTSSVGFGRRTRRRPAPSPRANVLAAFSPRYVEESPGFTTHVRQDLGIHAGPRAPRVSRGREGPDPRISSRLGIW